MSSDIETRILEMKLDNDQFEKGVKSTIQSLEELEEKLELKDAADGFDKVSKAANTMQFSSMERSLDAITDKFSLLGNVGLQALERISNKIVDIGENIIKGITIDPVMDGWREFEMKTNSIQTIFGGIRNQYANSPLGRSKAFSDIGRELDELNQYADQTIYSFAQMTENVGKFTNQSIGLETATDAIKGVGNWAAMVGADTAQMSRAMYNISQALGGGSMKLIDWRSIKYANMSTPDVQKLFADIAYAQGGMLDKNGKAYKKGSKQAQQTYKAIIADFEGNLKSGWLTNEVMMNGLKVLSGELKGEELVRLFGDTAEAKKLAAYYEDLGAYAAEAATQVKTLTQLIGVFQEALGSGWATTFDKLFGGFQKQTEFFTKIANLVGYFIDRDTENRNNWVDKFTKANEGTELVTTGILNIIGVFTEFWGLIQDVTQKLISPFNGKYWFNDPATVAIFGGIEANLNDTGMTAQHVAGIISDLNMAFGLFYAWFHGEKTDANGNVIEKATPAYQNAMKIFAGLGSVVMIALNAIENLFRFGGRILALFEPLASSILNMFGNVGEILYSIYQNIAGQHTFSDFFDELYKAVGPTISAIVNFISTILDLIASLFDLGTDLDEFDAVAKNNKLGPFIKTLSDIFEKFPVILKPALGFITLILNKMTGFISGIIKGFPAIKKHVKKEGVTPFEDLKDIVQEFIAAGFGEETAKAITDWYNNNVKGTFASLVNWFGKAYESITTFFQELPGKVTKLVERVKAAFNAFQNYNYNDAISPYQNFKDRMQEVIYALFGKEVGDKIVKTFKENIEPKILEVAGAIESAFAEVKRVLNGLAKVFTSDYTDTENPFDVLQAIALNFLEGYDEGSVDPNAATRKSSVIEFFKNLEESYEKDIKPVIDKVTGWVTKDIPRAFNTISRYLFGSDELELINEGSGDTYYETKHIGGLFDNILAWINGEGKAKLEEIVNFFSSTWTSITDAIFGYDTETGSPEKRAKRMASGGKITHVDGLVDIVLNNVKSAYEKITGWISSEGNALWQTATDFFFGEVDAETKKRSGGAIQAIVDWYNEHAAEIEEIFTVKIPVLFGQIRTALFGGQQPMLVGENKDGPIYELQHVDSIFKPVEDWINGDGEAIFDEVVAFFESAWESLNHVLFGYDDAINPEGTAVEHIPGLFENLKKWTESDGVKIWNEILDFMLGKSVTDKEGNVTREGGAFQAIQTFLDPIVVWIEEKGNKLYEYVTTHSFSEMWTKLGELFAGHEVLDQEGKTHLEGGYFSELLNALQPISNFFEKLGTKLFNKVTSVDYSAVWQSIREFFFGYDDTSELVWHSYGIGKGAYEPKHIDGLFDKLGNLIDRINAFFESDTWIGIKNSISTFYEQFIKPILTFFGGLGGTFFHSLGEINVEKGFKGNIEAIISSLTEYGSGELPKLLDSLGINLGDMGTKITTFLGGLLPSGLFGGEENKEAEKANEAATEEVEQQAEKITTGNKAWYEKISDIVVGMFVSSASAEDAATETIESSGKEAEKTDGKNTTIVEDVFNSMKGGATALLSGAGEAIGGFLGSLSENAGPLLTVLGVGGLMSNASNITSAIYGTENKNTIDRLANLIDALSGFLDKIIWLLALEGISELIKAAGTTDFNPLQQVFTTITGFLNDMITALVVWSGVTSVLNGAVQLTGDWGEDQLNTTMSADFTTVSENMESIGNALIDLMSAVSILIDNVWKILGTETALELLLGQGEDQESKIPRVKEAIHLVTECIQTLVTDISWGSLIPTALMQIFTTGGQSLVAGLVYGMFHLRTRTDSIAESIMAVGDLIKSVIEGVSGLLNSITLISLLTNPEDAKKKMEMVTDFVNALPPVIEAISNAITAFAAYKFYNALNGLKFTSEAEGKKILETGGTEGLGLMPRLLSKVGTFAKIALFLLAFADLVAFVIERNIQRSATILYVAAGQISSGINAFKDIEFGTTNNASESVRVALEALRKLGTWSSLGRDPVGTSQIFRESMSNIALGFDMITGSMNGYDPKSTKFIDALGQMNDAWNFFAQANEGKGFDVADFQGKMSILQLAGLNLVSVAESFTGLTDDDIENAGIAIRFLEATSEMAQIVSTMYGLGSLGTQMNFGPDIGLGSVMSFLKELSYVGTVSRDENGNIDGIQELDPEKIRGVFITMIDALPDPAENKELFDKLHSFIDAGGGNLGLFVNGFTGLNQALEKYSEVMYLIGTDNFKQQADSLAQIDKLGQSLTTDYTFLKNNNVANANTRLGVFANDLGALAQSLLTLGNNAKAINENGDTLGEVADFFHRINNLGAIYEIFNADDGLWYGTNEFGNHLNTFVSDFNSLQAAFSSFCQSLVKTDDYDFDSGVLNTAARFFERIAAVWNALGPAAGEPVINTVMTDAYDQFIAQTDRFTRMSVGIPSLGRALKDMYTEIKEIDFEDSDVRAKMDNAISFLNKIATEVYLPANVSSDAYRLSYLGLDLCNNDPNNPGLFNVLGNVFTAAKEFDTTGMANAQTAINSIAGIFEPAKAFLESPANSNFVDFAYGLYNDQKTGLFNVLAKLFDEGSELHSMPITELQSYAAAFSDLSNALAMNGQTATLVTAIDQAIEALKDKEIQIVVTPVWKDGSLAGDLNAPSMTVTPNVTNTYSAATIQNITFPDVQAVKLAPEDVTALTGATREAATTVAGRVDIMSNTIGGLRVQLDTGVLVGYLVPAVNRRMGRSYSSPRYIPVVDYTAEP